MISKYVGLDFVKGVDLRSCFSVHNLEFNSRVVKIFPTLFLLIPLQSWHEDFTKYKMGILKSKLTDIKLEKLKLKKKIPIVIM